MLRQTTLILAFSALASVASAATPFAPSAVLNVDQGTVLVNDGSQFVTAKPGQMLKAGDRVMVMTGGAATVKYSDGHSAALPSGTLVSFDARGFGGYASSGAATAGKATPIGPMYAQAVGGTDSDDSSGCDHKCVGWIFAGLGAVALFAATSGGGHTHDHSLSAP